MRTRFHSAARNEIEDKLKTLEVNEKIKELVLSYSESHGLPDSFITNIVKIAEEQKKDKNDSKWFLKMLADASKKHNKALDAQVLKESKKLSSSKPKNQKNEDQVVDCSNDAKKLEIKRNDAVEADLSSEKTKEPLFVPDELEHLLPYIKNLRALYPKLKNTAWFYILQNFGQWPLMVMAIFPERERLFPLWTVQAAATLKDVGLKKVLELGLEKDADALYQFLKREAKFYDHYHYRYKYLSHVRRILKDLPYNNENSSKDNDKLEEIQK